MTDTGVTGGLGALDQRVERAKRRVPPPRNPRATTSEPSSSDVVPHEGPVTQDELAPPPRQPAEPSVAPRGHRSSPSTAVPSSRGEKLAGRSSLVEALADAPTTMLGARVRTPLDDLLADAVHAARQHQVRTSKVELVEIALLSFAGLDAETLAEQVRQFRSDTNRYATSRR